MRYIPALLAFPAVLALAGCATTPQQTTNVYGGDPPHAAATLQGTVYGGQQPVVGATVTLYAAGTAYGSGATSIATATSTTSAAGGFSFAPFTCPSAGVPTYIIATGGNAGYSTNNRIALAAGLGPCSGLANASVGLNEVTTAATAYALSHFFTTAIGFGSTDNFGGAATAAEGNNAGLVMANTYTIPLLISVAKGTANTSTAAITLESAKLNSIANIIAACVNSAGGNAGDGSYCGNLLTDTTPPGSTTAPSDTLQAAVQMALYPYQNVSALFNIPPATSPFVGLSTTPHDWTLGVAYTSPTFGLAIEGIQTTTANVFGPSSSTIDIDANGRVWFPSTTSSAHGLAYFDPTSNSFNGPYGALTHPQYLAIDINGIAWGTDLQSNSIVGVNTTAPTSSVTYNSPAGTVTGPIGVEANASEPNAVVYTATSASASNSYVLQAGQQSMIASIAQTPTGIAPYSDGNKSQYYEAELATSLPGSNQCLLEINYTDPVDSDTDEDFSSANSGTTPCITGGAAQINQVNGESAITAASLNEICSYIASNCFTPTVPLSNPQGIAVDGDDHVWIANAGSASVSTLYYLHSAAKSDADYITTSPIAYIHNSTYGNTIKTPYGIAIDRSGNVWTSNAGCVSTTNVSCTPGSFVLSELIGAAAPTLTPLSIMTTTAYSPSRPQAVPTPMEPSASGRTAHQRSR